MPERKRFNDFAKDEVALVGEKLAIQDVIGKEIFLTAYRISKSKAVPGKECLQLQFSFSDSDEVLVTFTNSEVLTRQVKRYEAELPFITTIVKRGSYYTFS